MTTQGERHAIVTEAEPKTLGLVAGLGVGAAVFYYRALVDAHVKRGLTPHLLMVHADVRRVVGLAHAPEQPGSWQSIWQGCCGSSPLVVLTSPPSRPSRPR